MLVAPELAPLVLLGALLFDLSVGEFPTRLHPVVWMGMAISGLLRLAPPTGWWRQFLFGILMAATVIGAGVALAILALETVSPLPWLEVVVAGLLLKAAFSLRALGRAALAVVRPLELGDLDAARRALSSLCSRDPTFLGTEDLLAATVQSLAENASDSFVAPLFYFLLLGVPGAIGYRAINTLDAMVGYRGRFEALGKFCARLDDVANWIPARITAALFLMAGFLMRKPVGAGLRIALRDAGKTPSPNGGWPMATMAGLLGVRLEKKAAYILGDPVQPLTPATVLTAWRIVVVACLLMAALVAVLLGLLAWGLHGTVATIEG